VSEEVQERLDQEAEQKRELEEDVEAVGGPQQKMAVAKGQDQLQKKPRGTVFLEVGGGPGKGVVGGAGMLPGRKSVCTSV
jgi:tRNA G46 methylase TrmB